MDLQEIRQDLELVNDIDWDMTPEEAVTLYLEWGNNWSHGRMVKSKGDVSHYFVVNTWERPVRVILIRRNSTEAVELASVPLPQAMEKRFLESVAHDKGVHPLDAEIRKWLQSRLAARRGEGSHEEASKQPGFASQ